ncbi:MAG TPA: FHA domain-containing protein [Gemmatales bacterium]|nr:FHA domain-containing protein [Gemmatales bacterium]
MLWQLWRLNSNLGQRVILVHQDPFIIGSAIDCNLREPISSVSSHHCRLFQKDGNLYLEDTGSLNGTYVNGQRLVEPSKLRSNDIIEFGSTWMVIGVREDCQWIKTKMLLSA